jgi:hypothetical protein
LEWRGAWIYGVERGFGFIPMRLVHLTAWTTFDVGAYFVFEGTPSEIPLDEFDGFALTRMAS